ncbi:16S rRNA (cytosine(967)-C(5))-methyltransferase RsmB [Neglectibacter caecimuris]|uniref:16S rRNA (cytosine(967)-C(5))-methyltransferase RsmB n=1 Tax=Neglectibacter caecimuris TaxID=3093658 RepID=UPI002AC97499|nr:16S rRNA (cytosine(967)-C(5))-methyltransferase RsmB [Neglectibacter sp. M00184]
MKRSARSTALDALLQMEKNEGYSNLVIDKALKAAQLDRRDAALASTIFYGVLEKQLTLDYFLEDCLRSPGKKLDQTVRMALRCAAYQICFLDRIPDSAAVNETVNLVKEHGKPGFSGLVNGVLRTLIRRKESLLLPEGEEVSALSLRYSVPKELISLWQASYGKEITLKLLKALTDRPKTYVRVNTLKLSPEELKEAWKAREIPLEPLAFPQGCGILENCGSPASLPEFQEGLFHVQDLSAQMVCEIVAPRPGENLCDCCAAPGGKTFTLAEMMGDTGAVTALELYRGRVRLISDGAKRLGLSSITAKMADASKPITGLSPMDRVLCDVPCSGYGVIRRKPEIRYKSLASIQELPKLQYKILQNAATLLKPGGRLIYSTCTLNPAENGEVAEKFLRENPGFAPMKIELPELRRTVREPSHHLTMLPFSGASDGFFAAAFLKK